MSEEVKNPKRYILMLDEVGIACMRHLVPGMLYAEVEGMGMSDNPGYQLLVSPLPPVEAPVAEEASES